MLLFIQVSVAKAQQLKNVTPNQAYVGESLTVTVSGKNTQFQQGSLTMNLKQQLTFLYPSVITRLNDTIFTANFIIPISTPVGYYDVNVTTNNNNLTLTGGFLITFPSSIDNTGYEIIMEAFPVPAGNVLHLTIKDPSFKEGTATIYSLKGEAVKTLKLNEINSLDIKDIPAGVYFITITTKQGSATKKFIKQ